MVSEDKRNCVNVTLDSNSYKLTGSQEQTQWLHHYLPLSKLSHLLKLALLQQFRNILHLKVLWNTNISLEKSVASGIHI